MLSGNRAAALLVFAGLFAATLAGQADAASTAAVSSGQDDSVLTHVVEAAKLRALTAARKTASSRKLLAKEFNIEKFIEELMGLMKENNGKLTADMVGEVIADNDLQRPYRRSLMGLQEGA